MSKNDLENILRATLAAGLLFVVIKPAYSSGFALKEQSITYLGNAYAGTSSAAHDASSSYYNPAAMSELKYSQLVLSAAYIDPTIKLYSTSATNSAGQTVTGNNPSISKKKMIIYGGHFALRVSEDFSLGLSVVRPFGMNIVYGVDDIARYMASTNKISTVDISPTFAFKVSPDFAIGAGLDILKIRSTIGSGVAWGNIGSEANGYVINNVSGHSLGYHVGILFKPWCKAKMGLVYFSGFSPRLSGSTISAQTQDFPSATSSVNFTMKLPDRINYSYTQGCNKKWAFMGEVEWTHWSRLKTLQLSYNSSALPGLRSLFFKNTWRVAVGADYKPFKMLTVKGGLGFEQSPTKNAFRSASMPDSDQYMLALGLNIKLNEVLAIQAGYAHVFFRNCNIAENSTMNALNNSPNVANLSTLNARVKKSTDIVGLQFTVNII